MAYRERTTGTRPNEVVRYHPTGLLAALFFMLVLLGIAGAVLSRAIEVLRRIDLACERSTNMCTVRHKYAPFATETPVAVSQIATIDLRTLRNKKSTTYVVTLYTKDARAIDLLSTPLAMQATSVRAAAEELAMTGPSATFTTQEGSPIGALVYALIATGLAAVSLGGLRAARLEFDFAHRTIAYTGYRWPLPPRRRLLRADNVVNAVVTQPGAKAVYEVELVIRGEDNLRLVRQTSGHHRYQLHTATEINTHLSAMRET